MKNGKIESKLNVNSEMHTIIVVSIRFTNKHCVVLQ